MYCRLERLIASIGICVAVLQWSTFVSGDSDDYDSSNQDQYELFFQQVQQAAQKENALRTQSNATSLNNVSDNSSSSSSREDDEEDSDEIFDMPRSNDWDLLIFTQLWPVTICYHWQESDKSKQCLLPKRQEFWTIHGVWPTKVGTIGPSYCNRSAEFDVNKLTTIMEQLKLNWPEIDAQRTYDWLWQHEWEKHGTCAQTLEALDSELKYFNQAIDWHSRYFASNLLSNAGIHPDSQNTIDQLQSALLKSLGKNAYIDCIYDGKTKMSFLSEIRLCFDKSLQLVNCDGVRSNGDVRWNSLTNCHAHELIHYPRKVPPIPLTNKVEPQQHAWNFSIVKLYKLVKLIMMITF